jgi:hypothetical protein
MDVVAKAGLTVVRTQRNYHKLQTAHNKFEMCPTALEGFTKKHMYLKIK